MTATITKLNTHPKARWEPVWYRKGRNQPITDAFIRSHRGACIDQTHLFYSDDLSEQAQARRICSTCPVFEACALYSLYGDLDREGEGYFGIAAGMDPDERRKIRSGDVKFYDWRRHYSYVEEATKAAYRTAERTGKNRKSDRRRAEMPLCVGCGSNHDVCRDRRDRTLNRQQYHCTTCGSYFLGEAI